MTARAGQGAGAGAGAFTGNALDFTKRQGTATFTGAGGVTANAVSGPLIDLTATFTPGADRNNFTGQVGMVFTPTASLTVFSMGLRKGTSDTGVHAVNLYNWADGAPIGSLVATVNVDLTSGSVGTFFYATIPTPVTLSSGATYALVTPVTASDGQFWADTGNTTLNDAGNGSSVFTVDSSTFTIFSAGQQYLGVDLIFMSPGPQTAGATFTGAGAFTANGVIAGAATTWQGAATFAGAGTFTGTALSIDSAAASFAGAGGFTANTAEQLAAQATFTGTGGFTANATFSFATGFATFAGTGTFTANAGPAVLAAAGVFTGTGAFTANAQLIKTTQALFAGAGTFTANATAQFAAQATFAGIGGFTANAITQIAGKQGAANFNGVGAFTANAAVRIAAQTAFAGSGAFTANAAVRMASQAAFTGTGAFVANATRQGVTIWTGQAAFIGSGAFITSATVLSFPLPVPSGRWSPVFDTNYPQSGAISPSAHFLDITMSEIGFTLYFITPTATDLPAGAALVFTRPDGSSFRITTNRFYTGQNSPVIGIDPLNGAYAAYVTNADLNQKGTWTVEIRDAANNNISGAGYFSVAA